MVSHLYAVARNGLCEVKTVPVVKETKAMYILSRVCSTHVRKATMSTSYELFYTDMTEAQKCLDTIRSKSRLYNVSVGNEFNYVLPVRLGGTIYVVLDTMETYLVTDLILHADGTYAYYSGTDCFESESYGISWFSSLDDALDAR